MTITIQASSRTQNIRKSVNNFVNNRLVTQAGHDLDWGQPNFKEEGLERWIQFRLLLGSKIFQRQVDSTRLGSIKGCFLNFNIFEIYPSRQNIYKLNELRESIIEWMYLERIPIYDYDTGGTSQVNDLEVHLTDNDSEIDNGKESGLRQWNILFLARFLSKFS